MSSGIHVVFVREVVILICSIVFGCSCSSFDTLQQPVTVEFLFKKYQDRRDPDAVAISVKVSGTSFMSLTTALDGKLGNVGRCYMFAPGTYDAVARIDVFGNGRDLRFVPPHSLLLIWEQESTPPASVEHSLVGEYYQFPDIVSFNV